jgi:hypothetical protein
MRALLLLLPACAAGPVAAYRVDTSTTQEASCAGTLPGLDAATWSDSMYAGAIERIGVADVDGQAVLWTQADDWTQLRVAIDNGDAGYAGVLDLATTTVEAARLGSAWSALLENDDIGCEFDLHAEATVVPDGGWAEIDVWATVSVLQPQQSAAPCDIAECTASWQISATRSADGDAPIPGGE